MKYAHIDNTNNKLLGWYDDTIHSVIPTPNIQLTDTQYDVAISNRYNKINADGTGDVFDFRTAAEKFQAQYNIWKTGRSIAVDNIVVTYNGVDYQGDEISQGRLTRAILALPDDTTTLSWVSLDNTEHALTRVDFKNILLDAGMQQAAIWSVGRPVPPA